MSFYSGELICTWGKLFNRNMTEICLIDHIIVSVCLYLFQNCPHCTN